MHASIFGSLALPLYQCDHLVMELVQCLDVKADQPEDKKNGLGLKGLSRHTRHSKNDPLFNPLHLLCKNLWTSGSGA